MTAPSAAGSDHRFFVGLSRAFGGAVFFSLPLLMTMEMWQLGHYLPRGRVALFILLILPILIVLDRFSGFMHTDSWAEDAVDGIIAFGVGAVAATFVLFVLDIIEPGMPVREIVGKVALQAVPGGFGAVLANSQFSADRGDDDGNRGGNGAHDQPGSYTAEVFFMLVGAVFLAFNVAPTEEIVLLAVRMSPVHLVVMLLVTLAMMHAFVFASGFRGSPQHGPDEKGWGLFLRFTVVGYAVALLVSAWVLWTFGRFTHMPPADVVAHMVVLALPAGLGAAAARLIL